MKGLYHWIKIASLSYHRSKEQDRQPKNTGGAMPPAFDLSAHWHFVEPSGFAHKNRVVFLKIFLSSTG